MMESQRLRFFFSEMLRLFLLESQNTFCDTDTVVVARPEKVK